MAPKTHEGPPADWDGITERRSAGHEMHEVKRRLAQVEEDLERNTRLTAEVKKNTDEIVAFFEAGKGFFAVVRWTGVAAKWITTIAAAAALAWAVVKYGIAQAINELRK